MKKIYIIIGLLTVVAVFLQVVNIYFSNNLVSDSPTLTKIDEKIDEVDRKNTLLRAQLLELISFETISSRAAELGFVEPKETISLSNAQDIARKQ